ncbi:amidohydrolase family protein [Rhabdobacter roseus]|uniref:L-fuconolactonase n=1 Tax=Rhabdobacter roseus TaxID=1655419 RepID=A0A840TXE3_9BACT|nr:amidohydrolase family protein [Rhabdobacter roseus]MBB5286282.1 L-fuconolactonase [Rhabdobacter roseus]
MIIDAHQHFWVYDPVRDAWITPEMQAIQRDFLPQDLLPVLKASGIDGCVAVQADQSEQETDFLVQLAEAHDFVKGVVGWVDLRADNLYDRLSFYSQFEKLKGFRHVVQAEPDDFLRRDDFIRGVQQLAAFDFTYDILIYPSQLEAAGYFVGQLPEHLPLVLDHIAKPYIKTGDLEAWAQGIKYLAKYPQVHCKLSGLVTEADWNRWKAADFRPYLDVVVEAFGTDRLMFGSDWPVCLVAASYPEIKAILDDYLAAFSEGERRKIYGDNAVRFYQLND